MNTWTRTPLGDLCDVSIGRTPPRDRPEYWGPGQPWLSIADMNQGRSLVTTKESISDLAVLKCGCKPVKPGTVLLSFKLSIGKVGIAQVPLFTNEAIAALPVRDSKTLSASYLYWALKSIDLTAGQDRAAMGLTLNKAKLLEIKIPLPPIEDQERIAKVLDQAEALRLRRQTALAMVDTLAHELFLDLFGDPRANLQRWDVVSLGELCTRIVDGPHKTPAYAESGVPFITVRNIVSGILDFEDAKFISSDDYAALTKRVKPERGDILVSKDGTIGVACPVETDKDFCIFVSVALLKLKSSIINQLFLVNQFKTDWIQSQVRTGTKGIAIRHLHLGDFKKLLVIVPPMDLQLEFVRRVSVSEKLKGVHRTSLSAMDRLLASLQHRAFRSSNTGVFS